jgi:nitrite reductase/ring-hydroxylating ferredoxin subunit
MAPNADSVTTTRVVPVPPRRDWLDRPSSPPDPLDEMIQINGGQLRLRAECTDWHSVADVQAAPIGRPIRFATDVVAGFLTVNGGGIVAVVGACSRCGCLLQLDADGESLRCPAGGAVYRPDGRVRHPGGHYLPPPLTRLDARLAAGKLQALVPRLAGANGL